MSIVCIEFCMNIANNNHIIIFENISSLVFYSRIKRPGQNGTAINFCQFTRLSAFRLRDVLRFEKKYLIYVNSQLTLSH